MEAFVARLGRDEAEAATEEALDLMFDAWDAPSLEAGIKLAKRALGMSPLCADAHVFLARALATTPGQEIELLQGAVSAAEIALGPQQMKTFEGEFWGRFETRPYMRARHYLGLTLAAARRNAEAAETYATMLTLNPNDNQGARYLLLEQFLILQRHAEATALIARYRDDDTAHWLYSKALLLFRTKGDTAAARKALAAALAQNAHVPAYLLGAKRMPRRSPDYIGWGDTSEAVSYVEECGQLWRGNPPALSWLGARAGIDDGAARAIELRRRAGKGAAPMKGDEIENG
jgi:tetratricopeptide (TPR) repeat protein